MLEGDRRYFVAELNCDIAIHPTIHGKAYAPFLKQETVDNEMRMNPEKALREYYCRFTDEGGVNQIIPRSKIEANSYVRPPVLYNDTGKRKFIMAFDPARSMDNSIVSIGELIDDPKEGLKLDIVNCVSMIDIMTKKKTPKTTTQQIIDIRQLLIDYNGAALDYDNIEVFLADAGSGGGGNSWVADNLFEDWVDVKGNKHHGLIDRE